MKRYVIPLIAALALCPALLAQEAGPNHGEVGVYGEMTRLRSGVNDDFWGLGGRASLNVFSKVQLEAEMTYDFSRTINEGFTNTLVNAGPSTFAASHVRILNGLFGPKLQTGGGAWRAFVTVKGGFVDFLFDNRPATFATFTSSVEDLRNHNFDAGLYPGGGVEVYAGPVGIRLDVGDLIYFANGAHHNLRIALGPHIRF